MDERGSSFTFCDAEGSSARSTLGRCSWRSSDQNAFAGRRAARATSSGVGSCLASSALMIRARRCVAARFTVLVRGVILPSLRYHLIFVAGTASGGSVAALCSSSPGKVGASSGLVLCSVGRRRLTRLGAVRGPAGGRGAPEAASGRFRCCCNELAPAVVGPIAAPTAAPGDPTHAIWTPILPSWLGSRQAALPSPGSPLRRVEGRLVVRVRTIGFLFGRRPGLQLTELMCRQLVLAAMLTATTSTCTSVTPVRVGWDRPPDDSWPAL